MIRLGPAGNIDADIFKSLERIKEMGLNVQEVEFVRQVWMKNEVAVKAGELAKKLGIELSVHASYYINLSSEDKQKIEDSKKRILLACERAHLMDARYVVFHAGYYGKRTKEEVYEIIKKQLIDLQNTLKENKWTNVVLAPETTGKASQFGNIDELIRLNKETGCGFCVDFAHLYARNIGKINYKDVFDKLKPFKHIHAHFSGIEYSDKGERRHLVMDKKFFEPLAKEILERKTDITIISESPITYEDSLKMKEVLEEL